MSHLVSHNSEVLVDRITGILSNADEDIFAAFTGRIMASKRIFIVGMGRSGLVGKFFGMQLMHLGKTVYIVGETNTPSIADGDLLIAVSGSGSTSYVLHVAEVAKANNAGVVGIFLKNDSDCSALEKLADLHVCMNRRYMNKQRAAYVKPDDDVIHVPNILPMGTLFEISALVYFESVIADIIRIGQIHEASMRTRHSNLE